MKNFFAALPFAFISFKDINTLNPNTVTVSGLSSGALMASQMLVNSSSKIQGAGIIAGAPFGCAQGSLVQAFQCIGNPEILDINTLVKSTRDLEKKKSVDPLSNLQNRYVFLLNGKNDQTVKPGNGPKSVSYFQNFMPEANIKTEFSLNAGHSMPTVSKGNACSTEQAPWVNKCNYDTVQNMMEFLLQRTLAPSAFNPDHLYQIDLTEQVESGSDINTTGLVYVPAACRKDVVKESGVQCDLHIVFHGCRQTLDEAGLDFIKLAGYNDWAENNNIVMFYPNILKTMENPKGCWDWWGYSSPDYNNKKAPQSVTVLKLIKELTTQQK